MRQRAPALTPAELELVVCGAEDLDFHALEGATRYDGGYTKESAIIVNFWSVVHAFSDDEKKRLLSFSTGSDRCPVGGLGRQKSVISKGGPDSDRLPSAHTCFNVLLLPEYPTREKLERLLRLAIQNSEGFGML